VPEAKLTAHSVIHIGTLHYRDDRWIEIQLRYLERHTEEPYRVYASLDGIDHRHHSRFDQVLDHSDLATDASTGFRIERKLNLLTAEMVRWAEPDELLVIMHGDTFPITDWVDPVRRMVAERGLAAIRRDENMEPIPHWSFCATTPAFWTEIGGDWSRGPVWEWIGHPNSDTGSKLWETLEQRGIDWQPILRTNKVNLHPVWFGIYGDILYHHGAGFRVPMSRFDASEYWHLPVPLRNFAGVRKRISNTLLARRMFRQIKADEDFYLPLIGEKA
jgi:hypothetical protein